MSPLPLRRPLCLLYFGALLLPGIIIVVGVCGDPLPLEHSAAIATCGASLLQDSVIIMVVDDIHDVPAFVNVQRIVHRVFFINSGQDCTLTGFCVSLAWTCQW